MHSVFVHNVEGKPLTPTTPARARRLLKTGAAVKVWSKFGTFGIRLLTPARQETPLTALGYDPGAKFEGHAVTCGSENLLAAKLDLPNKKIIVAKIKERSVLRHARRQRKCRRRPARFNNRTRDTNWLAPSQRVIVGSRLKVLRELFRLYPIQVVGLEDVGFNHAKHRWGANFSTMEVGKARLRQFFRDQGAEVREFQGFETKVLREKYGYRKTRDKSADRFEAHCSDALALACEVGLGIRIEPGVFLVVDDSYRPVRRQLHDTEPAKGGERAVYSRGTVFGLRKGLKIGTLRGKSGQLCGEYKGGYRYYYSEGKRHESRQLAWISSEFIVREGSSPSRIA